MNAGIAADHRPAMGDSLARPLAYDIDCKSVSPFIPGLDELDLLAVQVNKREIHPLSDHLRTETSCNLVTTRSSTMSQLASFSVYTGLTGT
jgi:hypothetical protein